MNAKALIPLAAGLGVGGFALWMGFNTLKSARGGHQTVEKTKIWAAQSDIPRGTVIAEEMISSMLFPADMLPEGAITEKDKLIGRVPRIDAPAGLPVIEGMLLEPGARAGINVKPGHRAVALQIDAGSGVDYHLEPGCFVDVVGSFPIRRQGRQETIARTVVENVEVAAVGPRVSAVHTGDEVDRSKNRVVRAVTLFVQPDDVPKLLLAEQKGRIKLSMRAAGDETHVSPDLTVTAGELTGEASADDDASLEPEPVVVAAATVPSVGWEMSVYRGQVKEIVRFKGSDSRERADADVDPAPEPPTQPPPEEKAEGAGAESIKE